MMHAAPGLFEPLRPWAFDALRPHDYNLIVADPPWLYEARSDKGEVKGAAAQYRCYLPEEIAWRFPIGDLADPECCLLLLWATWPLFARQVACLQPWGFEFKSVVVWQKVFPSGKPAIGTGYRVRSMCEPVIVAARGEQRHKPFPGLFKGVRRLHSQKPEEFYDLADDRCPLLRRRADIFVRTRRAGWDGFGDEIGKFDGVAA